MNFLFEKYSFELWLIVISSYKICKNLFLQNAFAKCPIKKDIPIPVPINDKTVLVLVLLLTGFSQACDSTDALNDHTVQVCMLDKGFGQSFLNPLHNQLELIGITGKEQAVRWPYCNKQTILWSQTSYYWKRARQQADNASWHHILLIYMTEQRNHAYSVYENPVLP